MSGQFHVAKQKQVSLAAVWPPKYMQHVYADFQEVPDKAQSITVSYFAGTQ